MRRSRYALALAGGWLLLAAALLASCSGTQASVIRLATDRPELLAYAELYGLLNPEHKVEIAYLQDAKDALRSAASPDLVVASGLCCREILSQLDPLGMLFERGELRAEEFYTGILALGLLEGRQRALPVSFQLPAVVSRRDGPAAGTPSGVVLELDDLRRVATGYTQGEGGRLTRIGFSPLWRPEFLYVVAVLAAQSYQVGPDSRIVWNNAELSSSVEMLRRWVGETGGGLEQQEEFASRYLYEPFAKLLRSGRVLYYYVPSRELFNTPPARLEGLDFRWLSAGERIPVLCDVVAAGVPRDARNKSGARSFLCWLCTPAVQEALVADVFASNMEGKAFGVAGGFSALRTVNERILPRFYPSLIGHVPAADFLLFPGPLPVDWPRIRDAVLLPWLQSAVRDTEAGSAAALPSRRLEEAVERLRGEPP